MNKSFVAVFAVASIFVAGCGPLNGDSDCGAGCRDTAAEAPGDVGRDVGRDVAAGGSGDVRADVVADQGNVVQDASDATGGDASVDIFIAPAVDCWLCKSNDECGPGYTCQPVGAEKHCLSGCVDDGDCLPGFTCYSSGSTKSCLPVSYSCPECIFGRPCSEGRCCDFSTGLCKDCARECQKCTYDYDCGEGLRCRKAAGNTSGLCVPECADGTCPDPVNQTCTDNGRGVMLCIADKDYCAGRCFPPTPNALEDGTCVECVDDQDCEAGEICDSEENYCRGAPCPKGQLRCDSGQCRQCCVDDDCLEYPEATGYCLEDGTCEGVSQCDGLCTADFPNCIEIDGVKQCVECADDADCSMLGPDCTCLQNIYACGLPDGHSCISCYDSCVAMCKSDIDCPSGSNGAVLSCVQVGGSGICFDPAGACDGSGACCAPGQKCYDLVDLAWELTGLGDEIERPAGMATACSCSKDNPCLGETPCSDMSVLCKFSFLSVEVASYLKDICPDGQLAPAIPQYLCMDPRDFLSGLVSGLSFSAMLKQGIRDHEQITGVDLDDGSVPGSWVQPAGSGQSLRVSWRMRGPNVKRCF